jgi:RNA polymerase sigma-70 factor, ECF subfamily
MGAEPATHTPMEAPAATTDRDGALLPARAAACAPPAFERVYEETFDFVWRCARRLGADAASLDDVVQDVFVVVHRRLPEFEGRASLTTWVFGIVRRVVRDHRRTRARKGAGLHGADAARVPARAAGPAEHAERAEAARVLNAVLEALTDERREVFVLAELEQMSAPEIAEALGENVNTVYSRLRAARADFDAAVGRHRARDGWRLR